MRFFISFSSKNRPVVREIMAGLRSQNIGLWDYSDEDWSIEMTAKIFNRLRKEIDGCDYFVAVVSKESVDPSIGHFTRLEVEYALQVKKLHEQNRVLTIELEGITSIDYTGPYAPLIDYLHYELIWNDDKGKSIRSYIGLIKKICKAVGIDYMPRISPHHRMPFWERFRDEIQRFDHRISSHIELMGNLGEFNEFFKRNDFGNAYKSISHFVFICEYSISDYLLLYPWIVKGITEQFLGKLREAIESYKKALITEKNNPDALAGLGQAYRFTGDYPSSVLCYEKARESATGIRQVNMLLNVIFSKVSGRTLPNLQERDYIYNLDVDKTVALDIKEMDQRGLLPDITDGLEEVVVEMSRKDARNAKGKNILDGSQEAVRERENVIADRSAEEKGLILAAKALTCYCEADTQANIISGHRYRELMQKAYHIFRYNFPEDAISETGLVYYYYLTARNLKEYTESERILKDAIARAAGKSSLNHVELNKYLAEHYLATADYAKSIEVYEKELSGHYSDMRVQVYYALALYKSGNVTYRDICRKVLETLPSGYPGFYWSGFAHYLLGEINYALQDFERSNRFGEYYDGLV
jgi:tetratricopeptide (TPR) repeat protein